MLTKVQSQIHIVRVLNALEHGLRLPPRWTLRIMQIRQEGWIMIIVPIHKYLQLITYEGIVGLFLY